MSMDPTCQQRFLFVCLFFVNTVEGTELVAEGNA